MPTMNIQRRPRMSPARPPSSGRPPEVRVYPFSTQDRLAAYLVTKRGPSKALIEAVGVESELMTSCWMAMRETTERLLAAGPRPG